MTQTRDILPLRMQLTAMQVPEATPQSIVRAASRYTSGKIPSNLLQAAGTGGCQLLIHPGEASEIVVQLENLGNRPLHLDIQVEGNFRNEWCRLGMEGHELPARGHMEAVLYFHIPADFFESEEALRVGESLKLDYRGQIYVNYTLQAIQESATGTPSLPPRQHIQTAEFSFYIRPHSLYLNFLPEIYREVDFIGRLLKLFEQAFEPTVQTLDVLWAYLDPLTAPETLLPFLAYWVGWPLSPALSLTRQRQLIGQAMEIYRWRGTKRGLRFYLHLYTSLPLDEHLPEAEKHISIQELFGKGFLMGETHIGQDSIIGGGQHYHFMVTLRPEPPNQIDKRLIHQIIEQEKPAFCTYELNIVNGNG